MHDYFVADFREIIEMSRVSCVFNWQCIRYNRDWKRENKNIEIKEIFTYISVLSSAGKLIIITDVYDNDNGECDSGYFVVISLLFW